jgi:hypothetical protein
MRNTKEYSENFVYWFTMGATIVGILMLIKIALS